MTRLPALFLAAMAALLATSAPARASVLAFREVQKNLVNGVDGLNGAQGIAVSPDGAHVYVAGENDNALVIFGRDASTGALTQIGLLRDGVNGIDGLAGARAVALSADGAYVYVAAAVGDKLAVFSRDAGTGFLTLVQVLRDGAGGVNGLDGAGSIAISPDGASLYVAGAVDNAVAAFSRNAETGTLAFVQVVKDALTLKNARTVIVSPDGGQVYAAASGSDTVVTFTRDAGTGLLTMLQVLRDNTDGIDGLDGARAVALGADGAQLYVAGQVDGTVSVFNRDAATGTLTFAQMIKDGTVLGNVTVNGLNGAYGVLVSRDGKRLFVVGNVDDGLAVFDRDPATGLLTYLEAYLDGVRGVDGLNGSSTGSMQGLATSPSGRSIYAAGFNDDAVAVFDLTCGDGIVQANEQCDDGNTVNGDCCTSACRFELAGSPCASDDNGCTDDQCNAGGTCTHVPNTAPCDDGLFCTVNDSCQAGTCTGAARDCSAIVDQCSDGICDEAADTCVAQTKTDGSACNDGDLCTQTDTCQAGACIGANPVVCAASDQCHDAGTCDPQSGLCSNPVKVDGIACNDGDLCTRNDSCQAGACIGANPVVCAASDQCHDAGTCDPQSGICSNPAKADGTTCDDADACTSNDTCQAGACQSGAPVVCVALDQCHEVGTCNPQTGLCSDPAKANGTACDDNDLCTRDDSCQAGTCTGASRVVCAASDQCHQAGTCDPGTGFCADEAVKADGTTCDDGNACTSADSCQAGVCQSGTPVVCAASDQCHEAGVCDPATGCSNPVKANGASCDDGNACTSTDSCQAGTCTGTNPVVCSAQDQCHDAGTCNPQTGLCSNPPKGNGTTCDDGNACTRTDTCQAGACTGANPVVCNAADACHDAGTCDPGNGVCSTPAKADGTSCDDGDQCTVGETCHAGVCGGATLADADGDGVCDLRDVCPAIPNPDQADSDHNGVGDACECTQQAPGRCIPGGGSKATDCLVEVNPVSPAVLNPRRTGVLGVLRCTDGDPSCDLDGAADAKCTFGIAVCLANQDPRLAKCQATGVQSFEVLTPNPDRSASNMDRANGLAIEQGIGSLGLEIRRRGQVLTPGGTLSSGGICSTLVRLEVPAPTGKKPVRRTVQLRGAATDRRIDTDRVRLECRR